MSSSLSAHEITGICQIKPDTITPFGIGSGCQGTDKELFTMNS